MLRLIFVFAILIVGSVFAIQSPFYALLLYLWNAYFRPDDWTYGGLIASLQLSWFIGAYVVLATTVSMPRLRFNLRIALILLFFAQTLFSTLSSEHPIWSWNGWVDFSKVLIITYIIVLLCTDRYRFRMVLLTIAVSLGFECAKQGWAQLVINPGGKNDNIIVFLGDNNGVAVGTMMLVPIISALAQTTNAKWQKFSYRFVQFGVFMRGLSTYSRGGFLSAAVLTTFGLIRSPRKFRALIGVVLVALMVLSIMPQQFWDRMNTINAAEDERDDSAQGRLHFWGVARVMASRKPLQGVGFNGFAQSYESYNVGGPFAGERQVHSVWFGVLSELGYPGFVLFVAILFSALWSCWRVSRQTKRDPELRELYVYANALMTSLVTFAVGGTFLSSQYNEMFWHFVGLSLTLPFLVAEARAATLPEGTVPSAIEATYQLPHAVGK